MPEETPDPGNFYARLASSIDADERRLQREFPSRVDHPTTLLPDPAYSRQEWRRISARDFGQLVTAIIEAKTMAIERGHEPTDVLLGPREARIFEVEMNWKSLEPSPDFRHENKRALFSGNMDGFIIHGLRIRTMKQDGLRVAITFSPGGD